MASTSGCRRVCEHMVCACGVCKGQATQCNMSLTDTCVSCMHVVQDTCTARAIHVHGAFCRTQCATIWRAFLPLRGFSDTRLRLCLSSLSELA